MLSRLAERSPFTSVPTIVLTTGVDAVVAFFSAPPLVRYTIPLPSGSMVPSATSFSSAAPPAVPPTVMSLPALFAVRMANSLVPVLSATKRGLNAGCAFAVPSSRASVAVAPSGTVTILAFVASAAVPVQNAAKKTFPANDILATQFPAARFSALPA